MKRVIKATEKDIDKIIELIDNRIEAITLAIKNCIDGYDFEKIYEKYSELEELEKIKEKLRPLNVKLNIEGD